MFGEIESFLSLWDRFSTLWNGNKPPVNSVPSRLVLLLESHCVHRNQIPCFISHDLTLADVQNDKSLIKKLSDDLLDDVCHQFAVRREWLDGAEEQIYLVHEFYKDLEGFSKFLDELNKHTTEGRIIGYLISPKENNRNTDALLVFQETIGFINNKAIDRYHLCKFSSYGFWRSRVYMTACIAMALKKRFYIRGITLPNAIIYKFSNGEQLLRWKKRNIWGFGRKTWYQSLLSLGGEPWYPEDMIDTSALLLKDIDPEDNNFGIKSALELWLELDEQGFMDSGFTNNREGFVKELSKYE